MINRTNDAAQPQVTVHGRTVAIRRVRATDVDLLTTLLLRLSPETRQQRYLGARNFTPATARAEAERLAAGRNRDHIVLLAVTHFFGNEDLVGVAELARLEDQPDTGEFAILVRDDLQGAGVGALLTRVARTVAPQVGMHTLQVDTMAENRAMQRLAARLGTPVLTHAADGIVQMQVAVMTPAVQSARNPRRAA